MLNRPSVRERRRTSLGQVSGCVAIHDAVAKGKIHLAKFILDAVDNHTVVDSRDAHGKTPLIRAMRIDEEGVRRRLVDLLLKYSADVNLVDNVGRSALSYACELHRNAVIRKLVMNNVDPNSLDNNGDAPLMYCAMTGNATGIEILSKSFRRLGLEVDRPNADGMTPLMVAAKNGFIECAHLLAHEAKASLNRRDHVHNMTALDWAREGGCSSPEIEALQRRSRTGCRPAVKRTSNDQNKATSQDHQQSTHSDSPIASHKCLTSSLPQIDSRSDQESPRKNTGSQPDIRSLHHDKRRLDQLSLSELSKKFQDLNRGSPLCKPSSSSNDDVYHQTRSREKSLGKKWGSHEGILTDSHCRLLTKSIPNDLNEPDRKVDLQEAVHQSPTRPLSAVGFFNKHCQQLVDHHGRGRPLSAAVTDQLGNRHNSVDLTHTKRPLNATENLALSCTHLPSVQYRHDTKSELYKLSPCCRSTEVLWQGKPHSPDPSQAAGLKNAATGYRIIRGAPKAMQEKGISLTAAEKLELLSRGDKNSSGQQHLGHLPPLSSASTAN